MMVGVTSWPVWHPDHREAGRVRCTSPDLLLQDRCLQPIMDMGDAVCAGEGCMQQECNATVPASATCQVHREALLCVAEWHLGVDMAGQPQVGRHLHAPADTPHGEPQCAFSSATPQPCSLFASPQHGMQLLDE